MKDLLSISEARKQLPKMIREIQDKPGTVFKITVRNETVAELRSSEVMVPAGEAVRRLANLRRKLYCLAGKREQEPVSRKIKSCIYPGPKP